VLNSITESLVSIDGHDQNKHLNEFNININSNKDRSEQPAAFLQIVIANSSTASKNYCELPIDLQINVQILL